MCFASSYFLIRAKLTPSKNCLRIESGGLKFILSNNSTEAFSFSESATFEAITACKLLRKQRVYCKQQKACENCFFHIHQLLNYYKNIHFATINKQYKKIKRSKHKLLFLKSVSYRINLFASPIILQLTLQTITDFAVWIWKLTHLIDNDWLNIARIF